MLGKFFTNEFNNNKRSIPPKRFSDVSSIKRIKFIDIVPDGCLEILKNNIKNLNPDNIIKDGGCDLTDFNNKTQRIYYCERLKNTSNILPLNDTAEQCKLINAIKNHYFITNYISILINYLYYKEFNEPIEKVLNLSKNRINENNYKEILNKIDFIYSYILKINEFEDNKKLNSFLKKEFKKAKKEKEYEKFFKNFFSFKNTRKVYNFELTIHYMQYFAKLFTILLQIRYTLNKINETDKIFEYYFNNCQYNEYHTVWYYTQCATPNANPSGFNNPIYYSILKEIFEDIFNEIIEKNDCKIKNNYSLFMSTYKFNNLLLKYESNYLIKYINEDKLTIKEIKKLFNLNNDHITKLLTSNLK